MALANACGSRHKPPQAVYISAAAPRFGDARRDAGEGVDVPHRLLAGTQVANNQLKVHDQVMLLEGSQATVQTVQALRSGAHAMKEVSRQTNIENVEQVRGCACVIASPLHCSRTGLRPRHPI
jgi:hypothetical protein